MTIDKYGFTCNECGKYEDAGTELFSGKIDKMKELGWLIRKDFHGKWKHVCPSCMGGFRSTTPKTERGEMWWQK